MQSPVDRRPPQIALRSATQPRRHAIIGVGARRLHFLSVLRAEVYVLQLRLGRVSARHGSALRGCPACGDRPSRVGMAAGNGLPGRRHAQRHGSRCARLGAGAHSRTSVDRGHPRSRAGNGHARKSAGLGRGTASIASAWACNRSCKPKSRAPAANTRRRSSRAEIALLRDAGIRQHQYRPDRRPSRANRSKLARIARLDRAPGARSRLRLHAGSG